MWERGYEAWHGLKVIKVLGTIWTLGRFNQNQMREILHVF